MYNLNSHLLISKIIKIFPKYRNKICKLQTKWPNFNLSHFQLSDQATTTSYWALRFLNCSYSSSQISPKSSPKIIPMCHPVAARLLLILLTVVVTATASPNDHRYNVGEEVPLYVNKVGPLNNPRYFSGFLNLLLILLFCTDHQSILRTGLGLTLELGLESEEKWVMP